MKPISFIFIIGIFCISVPLLSQKKDDGSSQDESIFDKAPVPIKRVEPKYPESMLKNGWEMNVYLKVFIDIDGNVASAKIEKIDGSSPNESQGDQEVAAAKKEFQEAASTAVKQWKFSPAQMQGKPVGAWVTIPFRFQISRGDEDLSKDNTARGEYERIFKSTRTIVDNVLKGKNIEEVIRQHINPDAYVIFKNKYASLYSVLKNETKDISLIEGEKSKLRFLSFTLSDDKNTASIVWKSQIGKDGQERYHTILFVRSKNEEWKIKHWHVSW